MGHDPVALDRECHPIRRKTVWTVYKLTDREGKSYVGCTARPLRLRLYGHFHHENRSWSPLGAAIRELGADAFTVSVLAEALTVDDARSKERRFIREHSALAPNGYNPIAQSGLHESPITLPPPSGARRAHHLGHA